jgi:hypothetical protein
MRQKPLLSIGVMALLLLGCTGPADVPQQSAEAQRDIERGHLELRGYGKPAAWLPNYARLLKDRLDVAYVSVAGCVVTQQLVDQTAAYNAAMTREIERRFGAGVLQRLQNEARKQPPATGHAA